jgi:hypothetical protein
MFKQQFVKLSFLVNMVISLVYHWMFLIVDFASFMIYILQITLVFEMQMPRDKHILLFEFPFTDTLLAFYVLLECPDIN